MALHRQGTPVPEMAFLVGVSARLVQDYVGVYEQAQRQPHRLEKLEEELARVSGLSVTAKKGVMVA